MKLRWKVIALTVAIFTSTVVVLAFTKSDDLAWLDERAVAREVMYRVDEDPAVVSKFLKFDKSQNIKKDIGLWCSQNGWFIDQRSGYYRSKFNPTELIIIEDDSKFTNVAARLKLSSLNILKFRLGLLH